DLNSIPWTPIGFSSSNFFSGNFDGNGHNIANMIVNSSTAINGYGGLFGYIKNATIKKVGIIGNSSVSGINYAGGIAGYDNSSSSISLCFNKANISTNYYSGGILGYGFAYINNCFNNGSISVSGGSSSRYTYASGISYNSNVSNCYNIGTITNGGNYYSYSYGIGNSTITNSYYINSCGASSGGTPQSEATMKSPAFVTLLNNGSTNWVIDNLPYRNGGYPMLSVLVKPYARVEVNNISAISATLIGKINEYVFADAQGFLYKKTNTSNYISIPIIGSLYQYNLNNLEPNTQYIAKAYIICNNLTYYGDSIIFSTLPLPITTTTTNICQGETYFFMDSSFSTTGIYPIVHNDTIHQLNLTVYPLYNDTLDINVCNGESFTFNDTIFSSSCYHTFYFQSIHGCDSIVTLHLTVLPEYRPIITITIDTSICRGDSITLTADGASSYLWNTNAITQSITVSPYNTTRYIVTASNSSDCYIKDTVIVTVKALPSPSITGTTIFCDGNSSTLTASGGVSYLWNTGDTTNSIVADTAGIYSVIATGSNGCSKAVQKNVTVRPLPNLSLNINDTSICLGESLLLIASGGSSYVWSSGQTSNSINVTPNSSTAYSITAYNSYNCSKSDTVNIIVNPVPIISCVGDTSICSGSSTNITIYGAENYLWSNGETSSTLSLNPSSSTQYTVIGTNSHLCSSSLSIPITVHQPTYTIDTIHSCNSYTWIDGITYSSNTNTPTYTLTSIHGCDSIVNLNLTIHQIVNTIDYVSACNSFTWINGITYTQSTNSPTYTLNSIYGCDSIVNLNLTMNYSSSGVDNQVHCKTYTWINGITYTSSTNTPTYTFTNFSGCDSIVRLNLRINPLPNVGITGNMDIFEGDTTELRASGANYYSWSNGLIGQTIFVSPTQTTQYSVAGADENNCTNTASITINVHPTISLNNIENANLISIYPNPTSGKINITYKSNKSSMQKIILLNVLGEKIIEKTIKNENEIFLDLSPYSSNIIFMEILLSNGEKFVKKIIKK
ncbi:MAG: T9SS type A sorting domain-containing protein, partial [Bacteroidales bacterium]|nr:T9SS type A sorting domain-containing protein [Bacteroidales bacterium]